MYSTLTVLSLLVGVTCSQRIPENPCPNIFQYRSQQGIYHGEITIPSDGSRSLDLTVNVSMVGLYQQNLEIQLELLTPTEDILKVSELRYRVNFPLRNVIPKITQIAFNGRIYCSGPPEPLSASGFTNLWRQYVFKINEYSYSGPTVDIKFPGNNIFDILPSVPPFVPKPSESSNPFLSTRPTTVATTQNPSQSTEVPHVLPSKSSISESCGVANEIQTLIIKGETTVENEYPWLVAMFQRQKNSYDFRCTANLISDKHVITAAHCVWFFNAPLMDKEDILLVMGCSDISHWASSNALLRGALEVTPHPHYRQNTGHFDVAIIKLNEEVSFKATVKPICLWGGGSETKSLVGTRGMVAGWGENEQGKKTVTIPRKIAMPVVSEETCLRSNSEFRNLTSDMTFCAGDKDGGGPCSGDSGAGFMTRQEGKWYLRGLVAIAIKDQSWSCNLNEYIVFADVDKLRNWIISMLK